MLSGADKACNLNGPRGRTQSSALFASPFCESHIMPAFRDPRNSLNMTSFRYVATASTENLEQAPLIRFQLSIL